MSKQWKNWKNVFGKSLHSSSGYQHNIALGEWNIRNIMQNIIFFYLEPVGNKKNAGEGNQGSIKKAGNTNSRIEKLIATKEYLEQIYFCPVYETKKRTFWRGTCMRSDEEMIGSIREVLQEWYHPEFFLDANLEKRLHGKITEPEHFLELERLRSIIQGLEEPILYVTLIDPGEGDPIFLEFTKKQLRTLLRFEIWIKEKARQELYLEYAEAFLQETGLIITFEQKGYGHSAKSSLVIDYGKADRAFAYPLNENGIYIDARSHRKRYQQIKEIYSLKKHHSEKYLSIRRDATLTLPAKMGIIR